MSHDARRPIGKGVSASTDNDGATWVKSEIVDKQAKTFVIKGVLQAYSVGIARPVVKDDPSGYAKGGIIVGGRIVELTLCDRPANPSCGVTIAKSAGDGSALFVGKAFGDPEKAAKQALKANQKALRALLVADLNSPDPYAREAAREALRL